MTPATSGDAAQHSLCFSKDKRLLNSQQFKRVFSACEYRASGKYCLFLAKANALTQPRLGLVIAKKHIRLAVQRNRIKRLIRESFRQQQHQLAPVDVIVLARKGLDQLDNSSILKQLHQLWQNINDKASGSRHQSANNKSPALMPSR